MADAPKFKPRRKLPSVGYIRRGLASISDLDSDEIAHYAIAMVDTNGHLLVQFCCDDRETAAGIFIAAGGKLINEAGESTTDRPPPPMPQERN